MVLTLYVPLSITYASLGRQNREAFVQRASVGQGGGDSNAEELGERAGVLRLRAATVEVGGRRAMLIQAI